MLRVRGVRQLLHTTLARSSFRLSTQPMYWLVMFGSEVGRQSFIRSFLISIVFLIIAEEVLESAEEVLGTDCGGDTGRPRGDGGEGGDTGWRGGGGDEGGTGCVRVHCGGGG